MTNSRPDADPKQATVNVDVDPGVAAAVVAWATQVIARVAPAAPLRTHPLLTWLRLRLGVRRCLACGRLGNRSLQPAHPLLSPATARTWRCNDRDGCRRHRTRQERGRSPRRPRRLTRSAGWFRGMLR
jgi:hypothetical protein